MGNIFSTNHRVYKIFVDKAYASNDAEFHFNFRSGGSSGSIQQNVIMLISKQTNLLNVLFLKSNEKFKTIFMSVKLQILQSEN